MDSFHMGINLFSVYRLPLQCCGCVFVYQTVYILKQLCMFFMSSCGYEQVTQHPLLFVLENGFVFSCNQLPSNYHGLFFMHTDRSFKSR